MNVNILTAIPPTVVAGTLLFLTVTLLLVVVLLVAKRYLVHSGKVDIEINGDRHVEAESGKSLLSTMADSNVFLRARAAARAAADSAACRCSMAEATCSPPRPSTSTARR